MCFTYNSFIVLQFKYSIAGVEGPSRGATVVGMEFRRCLLRTFTFSISTNLTLTGCVRFAPRRSRWATVVPDIGLPSKNSRKEIP